MKLQTPPTMRPGDASPFVSVWQLHGLVPRGLLPSSQVTGTMDKATIEATRAYQRATSCTSTASSGRSRGAGPA